MVNAALDESAGVIEYETSLAGQETRVMFDPSLTSEKTLMQNIGRKTGYTNLYVMG
jgi:hypothetical protein